MPFYFRKSVGAGPFRFNFSSGGIGVSVGVRGLRIGTGPRGHYVHAGRGGFYYRGTIGRAGERRSSISPEPAASPPLPVRDDSGVQMIEVDSGDVLAMQDEAFASLITDINEARQRTSMALVLGLGGLFVGASPILAFGATATPFLLLALAGWAVGHRLDSYRRTSVLFYDLEPEVAAAYEAVTASFDNLMTCAGKWHIEAGGAVRDLTTWKRNAGASNIVRKKPTTLGYELPRAVSTNITPPALHVGRQVIYFLPDVALVDDGDRVGAVAYSSLNVTWHNSNFIEEGVVPRDARVVSQTWKHPNKKGGPDRRFRDNRLIPVCCYEAMYLRSSNGVSELVEFSRTGVIQPFAVALSGLPKNDALTIVRPSLPGA